LSTGLRRGWPHVWLVYMLGWTCGSLWRVWTPLSLVLCAVTTVGVLVSSLQDAPAQVDWSYEKCWYKLLDSLQSNHLSWSNVSCKNNNKKLEKSFFPGNVNMK
jgi:hypothetical protein